MSEHIIKEQGNLWNTRVEQRMKDLGLSQRKFIEKYKKEYGTGSQADVSKWIHVGQKWKTTQFSRFRHYEKNRQCFRGFGWILDWRD